MSDESRSNITVEQFIERVAKAKASTTQFSDQGTELRGWIAWDGNRPDVVLFTPVPLACPSTPIPKDQIASLRPGNTTKCWGELGQMWDAIVYLKPSVSAEAKFFERLLNVALSNFRARVDP
jgi:hypothetical protein